MCYPRRGGSGKSHQIFNEPETVAHLGKEGIEMEKLRMQVVSSIFRGLHLLVITVMLSVGVTRAAPTISQELVELRQFTAGGHVQNPRLLCSATIVRYVRQVKENRHKTSHQRRYHASSGAGSRSRSVPPRRWGRPSSSSRGSVRSWANSVRKRLGFIMIRLPPRLR